MKEKVRIMNLKTKQKFKREIQRKGTLKQVGLSLSTERLDGNLATTEKQRRVLKPIKQPRHRLKLRRMACFQTTINSPILMGLSI